MTKGLNIQLGTDAPDHLITVNGEVWHDVLSLRIEPDADNFAVVSFKCCMENKFELEGSLIPSEGMPHERVPFRFVTHNEYTRCTLAGHDLRLVDYLIEASGDMLTQIQLDARLGADDDLTVTRIRGTFWSKGAEYQQVSGE